jgi:hypothetical protein
MNESSNLKRKYGVQDDAEHQLNLYDWMVKHPNNQIESVSNYSRVEYVQQLIGHLRENNLSELLTDEKHQANPIWEQILIKMNLTPFGVPGRHYASFMINYKKMPFHIEIGSHDTYESIKRNLMGTLTYVYPDFDEKVMPFYLVIYHYDYWLHFSGKGRKNIKTDQMLDLVNHNDDNNHRLFENDDEKPFTFTLAGVDDHFETSWTVADDRGFSIFSSVEILNSTTHEALFIYIISKRPGNDEIIINEINVLNGKQTCHFKIPMLSIKENQNDDRVTRKFQIDETTRVTKFYCEGMLSFLLYNSEYACSITFPVGSIFHQIGSKIVDLQMVNDYPINFSKNFVLVRIFQHHFQNSLLSFNDIAYFEVNEEMSSGNSSRICWYSKSLNGEIVKISDMMRLLIDPLYFRDYKTTPDQFSILNTMARALASKTTTIMNFSSEKLRKFFSLITKTPKIEVSQCCSIPMKKFVRSGIHENKAKVLLIQPIDCFLKQTICVLLQSRNDNSKILSVLPFTLDEKNNVVFEDVPPDFIMLDKGKFKDDFRIDDMDLMFIYKEKSLDERSLYYFQFKMKSITTDNLFIYTHGLYNTSLNGKKMGIELQDQSENIDTLLAQEKLLNINSKVFKKIFNRGYFCLHAKPFVSNYQFSTNYYIFYKNYIDDDKGRIVFFETSQNGENFNISEYRISSETFRKLINVIPVLGMESHSGEIRMFIKTSEQLTLARLVNSNVKITDENFNFASYLLSTKSH